MLDFIFGIALAIGAAVTLAAFCYRVAVVEVRRETAEFNRGYREGRAAERRAAGLNANAAARWKG